jgi:hypothetical protein
VDISVVAFVVAISAAAIGFFVELHLVSSLKDFYPAAYVAAGEPTYSNLLSRYSYNWPWRRYVMFRKFSGDPVSPSGLRLAFELAFCCVWVRLAGFAIFFGTLLEQFRHL